MQYTKQTAPTVQQQQYTQGNAVHYTNSSSYTTTAVHTRKFSTLYKQLKLYNSSTHKEMQYTTQTAQTVQQQQYTQGNAVHYTNSSNYTTAL